MWVDDESEKNGVEKVENEWQRLGKSRRNNAGEVPMNRLRVGRRIYLTFQNGLYANNASNGVVRAINNCVLFSILGFYFQMV